MRRRSLLEATAGATAVSSTAGCLQTLGSEDTVVVPGEGALSGWSMRRGDERRSGRPEGHAGPSDPSDLTEQWRDETPFNRALTLAVAGDYVYSDPGAVRVTDATTGEVASETLVDELSRPLWPIVEDDVVYASNHLGKLAAADARTGEVLWTFDAGGLPREDDDDATRFPITGAPARYPDGLLFEVPYVDEYDSRHGTEGLIECVQAGATASDQRCWDASYVTAQRASSSLLVSGGTLVVPLGGFVNAYDVASAERLWKQPVARAGRVATDDGTVVVPVGDGVLAAFDLRSGREQWRQSFTGPTGQGIRRLSPPAITRDGRVVFGVSDGTVRVVDLGDGSLRRTVPVPETVVSWTWPALVDGIAYVGGNGPHVVGETTAVDRRKGRFYAIDLDTGSVTWSTTDRGTVSAPVVADGGVVTAIDADLLRLA